MFSYIFVTLALLLQTTFCAYFKNHSKGYRYEDFDLEYFQENYTFTFKGNGFTVYSSLHESLVQRLESQEKRYYPEYFDWRDRNMVSPIKDQGECAACWAFTALGTLECHIKIYTNQELLLSEQFLIDCIEDNGKYPHCSAFTVLKAYAKMVSEYGGALQQQDYRTYDASFRTCSYSYPPPIPVPVIGFVRVHNNEDVMVAQLISQGPLSAAINSKAMDRYTGGNIIDEPTEEECSSRPEDMDHSVVIVGYNVYIGGGRKVPYWIIKNSWGVQWGSNGYYYLVRGRNACGIANDVSFPIVAK